MPVVRTRFGNLTFSTTSVGLRRIDLPPVRRSQAVAEPGCELDRRVAKALTGYFAGRSAGFTIPLDLSAATPFQRRVLKVCAAIPRGQVVTYGELARRAGKPGAARAVGRVMATNPIPIVIPCHRVVGSDLKLHGFGGGQAMKRGLLELEGLVVEGTGPRARVRRTTSGKR